MQDQQFSDAPELRKRGHLRNIVFEESRRQIYLPNQRVKVPLYARLYGRGITAKLPWTSLSLKSSSRMTSNSLEHRLESN